MQLACNCTKTTARGCSQTEWSPAIAARVMPHFMDPNVSALERAFQLAKSSNYATIEAIKTQLKREGYSTAQLSGGALKAQLLIRTARNKSGA